MITLAVGLLVIASVFSIGAAAVMLFRIAYKSPTWVLVFGGVVVVLVLAYVVGYSVEQIIRGGL